MRDGTLLYADVFRPDTTDEKVPAIMNIGPYQKDKLWVPPADLEEEANPYMNWETVNPDVVVPARLRLRARRYARLRQVAGQVGAELLPGRRSITYDAIEWIAKQPWCSGNVGMLGISYHAAFAVARREPAAAVAEGDHAVGRARRSVSRPGLSRRHLRDGLHRQLVIDAHRAPPARAAAQLQPRRVPQRHDVELHAQRPRLRVLAHEQRALGQDHGAGLQRRQLGRLLDASARQHRGVT